MCEKFVADAISPSGQKEFGQAVRHVLGLTVYDRALQHVKRAIEELDKSIAQLDNDDDLKKLTVKKTFINVQISELELKVKDSQQKIDSIQTQSEGIDNELKAFEQLTESIELRKKYEADIELYKKELLGIKLASIIKLNQITQCKVCLEDFENKDLLKCSNTSLEHQHFVCSNCLEGYINSQLLNNIGNNECMFNGSDKCEGIYNDAIIDKLQRQA